MGKIFDYVINYTQEVYKTWSTSGIARQYIEMKPEQNAEDKSISLSRND